MKKYFIFAAIATVGLFASCSSSDDFAANDVQNPEEDSEKAPQIRLNIGNVVDMSTRGTGTVGGVGTGTEPNTHYSTNVWAGQNINVFMFTKDENKKTTLNLTDVSANPTASHQYLYNNAAMYTPGSTDNLIPGMSASIASGEAMIKDGTINYYPVQGNFDFFGYRVDDAANAYTDTDHDVPSVDDSNTQKWVVPFTIDGSQDLMSTKAELTGTLDTTDPSNVTGTGQMKTMYDAGTRKDDYYSAYSARKEVHPTLTFKHLLSRLQFSVKAGKENAAGWEDEVTDATANAHNVQLPGALHAGDVAYNFTCRLTTQIDATENIAFETVGIAKKVGTWPADNPTHTKIQVIKNGPANPAANYDQNNLTFIGQEFYVEGTSLGAGSYKLYVLNQAGDGVTALDPDMSVKGLSEVDDAGKNAFNALLPGAIQAHAARLNPSTAVKIKKVQINSKTEGKLAVAWLDGAASEADYKYSMGMLSVAAYNSLDDTHKAHWTEALDNTTDPATLIGYNWATVGNIDKTTYDGLVDSEKAVATLVNGPVNDLNKIQWTSEDKTWLTLKARPAYKKKADADPTTVADVTMYADTLALLVAESASLAVEIAGMEAGDAKTAKQAELAALQAKMTLLETKANAYLADQITEEAYAGLSAVGQAKYEAITNNAKEKLIALTPTAPTYDPNETGDAKYPQTAVGEALIVAPNTENYEMKLTIAQDVMTNWNTPTQLSYREETYPLTIKAPAGGFAVNTSYNIVITVYSFERIEVIAVITPWVDGGNIGVGADD